jgi:ribosomal protein S1
VGTTHVGCVSDFWISGVTITLSSGIRGRLLDYEDLVGREHAQVPASGKLRVGDTIRVKVMKVDKYTGSVDFAPEE